MGVEQLQRCVGVLEQVELAVGLVEDHADLRRYLLDERADLREPDRGARRVVRVADDRQSRGDGDLAEHRGQVVTLLGVERDGDRASARGRGEVRVDREGGPGIENLGAGLQQRLARGEQHVARAVADRDPRGGDLVALGELLPQRRVRGVGVAVQPPKRALDRLAHGGQRRERRLVAREQRELGGLGVAPRGGVDRDPAGSALRTRATRAYCAACRSARSARVSRR